MQIDSIWLNHKIQSNTISFPGVTIFEYSFILGEKILKSLLLNLNMKITHLKHLTVFLLMQGN